jgi:hypothetical protein
MTREEAAELLGLVLANRPQEELPAILLVLADDPRLGLALYVLAFSAPTPHEFRPASAVPRWARGGPIPDLTKEEP